MMRMGAQPESYQQSITSGMRLHYLSAFVARKNNAIDIRLMDVARVASSPISLLQLIDAADEHYVIVAAFPNRQWSTPVAFPT